MAADEISAIKRQQIEIAERLQLKWLQRMEALFDDKTITSTDLATLRKFLQDNGWTVDETKLPQSLRDKLKESLDVDAEDVKEELSTQPYLRAVR